MSIGEVEVSLYFFFNLGVRWGGWATPLPGSFIPKKETRYPLYRRLGGPLSRSGRLRKISLTPGFDPRTVQPVAGRCIDHAIPVHRTLVKPKNIYAKMGPKECSEQSGQEDRQSGAVHPTAGQ